jgi:hypothetical protein
VICPEGGLLAVWIYDQSVINEKLDQVTKDFHSEVVGKFGENELKTFKANFENMKMPIQEIIPPRFEMKKTWTLDQLKG